MKKADALESEIQEIIRKIALDYNISQFMENPDFLEQRLQKWHQFGLITHTKKVRQAFLNEVILLLKKWNLYDYMENMISEKIDGVDKKSLFELSIVFHDLGKILVYGDERANREHEICSKFLMHEDFLKQKLFSIGLTENHIKYMSRCIESHDAIGKEIRDILKHQKNLNFDYLSNEKFIEMCKNISEKYSDIKLEIGIFFLCDSLGKTDIRISADSDEEILQKESEIEELLTSKSLSPELKNAAMQLPLNLRIAEAYLKNILH